MRIVDSHMHLIDVTNHDWYPGLKIWADSLDFPELYADFLVPDYRAGDPVAVDAFVHVSATTLPRAYLQETRWVDQLAADNGLDVAIVATVDATLDPTEILADLEAQAASSRLRGLRVLYDLEPDSRAADIILGWLNERGLVFDLVTNPDGMKPWLRAVERFPGLRLVLEHTGWPTGTDPDARAAWEEAVRDFATTTDSLCKLTGLGMTTRDTTDATLRPWLEYAIDQLGWDRVAFGSNLPIETMGGSHQQLVDTFTTVVSQASDEDRAKFWGGNATRAYWTPGMQ